MASYPTHGGDLDLMKKFISGLFAALLMTAGFVAVVDAPATANQARCGVSGYPPCVVTQTHANGPAKVTKHKRASYAVNVTASGNKKPAGTIVVIINPGHKKFTVKYSGTGKVTVRLPRLKPGKYSVTFKYIPKGDFKSSVKSIRLKVTK